MSPAVSEHQAPARAQVFHYKTPYWSLNRYHWSVQLILMALFLLALMLGSWILMRIVAPE